MTNAAMEIRPATERFLHKIRGSFPVTRAVMFGSQARGSAGPASDVDIAVFLSGKPARYVQTKLALADIAYDVLLETGIHIQPLPIWEEEWAQSGAYRNPRLLENISRDGVPL
jgi:antitoxin ChpS